MLPKNVQYQSKVEGASARRYLSKIQPQTGTQFGVGETIIINIPTRNNLLRIPSETVLRFDISMTLAAATVVSALESCGWHGCFSRMRLFHGSNLLEDVQNYSELAKILLDFQVPLDTVQGRNSVTGGTENAYVGLSGTATGADPSGVVFALPVNRGRNFSALNATSGISGATGMTASINLISFVGSLAGGKYLPLFAATSAPLRLELTVASSVAQIGCFSPNLPSTFLLQNVNLQCEFLELPDAAIAAIMAGSSNPIQLVLPDYRAYTYSQGVTASSAVQISMPIPAKFSSLKHIFVNSRNATAAATRYPFASTPLGLSQYVYRVGAETLPAQPGSTLQEYFNEACKCFGSLSDLNYQPAVDITAYGANYPAQTPSLDISAGTITTYVAGCHTNSGSFITGIDLENYQGADKSTIFAGMNTTTSDIYYLPQFNVPAGVSNIFFTAFAGYDCVVVFENGTVYTRF